MGKGVRLEDAVGEARRGTRVPGVAAAFCQGGETAFAADGVLARRGADQVEVETPFRIASITKPFTASLAAPALPLDDNVRALLSHTAGLRSESPSPLPPGAEGLFSYSNAGYWEIGARCAAACGSAFEDAMRREVLEPLRLGSTGFERPARPALGHVQEGESGQRPVPEDLYPSARRPSGGLWSTVGDLLRFAAHHLEAGAALHQPQVDALGARYALGWWVRELDDGAVALDHEGSIAGYQSLLLLVPARSIALAVLTNSWRGSGLIRRVVESLGLGPRPPATPDASTDVAGTYGLDGTEARV